MSGFEHLVLFNDPRSASARRLVELRERRVAIRGERTQAFAAEQAAEAAVGPARQAVARAEARELGLGVDEGLKGLRATLAKAEKSHAELRDKREKLAAAAEAVDQEMMVVASENLDEILAELTEDHDANRRRAGGAVRALNEAHAGLVGAYQAAAALTAAVRGQGSRGLSSPPSPADIVAAGGVGPLHAAALQVISSAPPVNDPSGPLIFEEVA